MTKSLILALVLVTSAAHAQPKKTQTLDLKVYCQSSWSGYALGTYQTSAGMPMQQELTVKGEKREESFASGKRTAIYWKAEGSFSGSDADTQSQRIVYQLNVRRVLSQKGQVDPNDFQPVGTIGAQLDVLAYGESYPALDLGANRARMLFENKVKDIAVTAYNPQAHQQMLNPQPTYGLEGDISVTHSDYVTDAVDVYCRVVEPKVAKKTKKKKQKSAYAQTHHLKKRERSETAQSLYSIF